MLSWKTICHNHTELDHCLTTMWHWGNNIVLTPLSNCCHLQTLKITFFKEDANLPSWAKTYQYVLNFFLAAFHMIEHHSLGNVLSMFKLAHFIVCVRVENRPAQELGQGLGVETEAADNEMPRRHLIVDKRSGEKIQSTRLTSIRTSSISSKGFPSFLL